MTSTATFAALCPGCFAGKGTVSLCPHCGYDESLKRGPLVLAHRTLLHHGQYLVGRVLGKPGGFGITYLALDTKLETRVAIKEYLPRDLAGRDAGHATISAHSAEDGEFFRYGLTQFLQEARTLAQFDHANIVRVRNFFEENGTGYLVMDYYDGVTLADYLAQQPQGRLPEKTAVGILMPILDGLREVHAKNFLHRDIKPQNIYLTTGNRPILLDFGAARQAMSERSRSLSVVLSEGYAPYEQYHRRGEQGPWTDIYACAAVLYHAVAGEAPPPATERMHKDELNIAALGVSASLANALRLGLAADHHNRPQRMTEFQGLLLGGGEPKGMGEEERKPRKIEPTVPAMVVAPQAILPTNGKSPLGQMVGWQPVLAALWAPGLVVGLIVSVGVISTMCSRGEKKAVPTAAVATPVAVTPAPTIAAAPITVPDDPDTILWNEAKTSGERRRLDAYLKQYPKGKFIELAKAELNKLDEREAVERNSADAEKQQAADQLKAEQSRAEQRIWDQAKADNTPDAYAQYLKNYQKGRYVAMATTAQQKLQIEAAEKEQQQAAAEVLRHEQEARAAEAERARQEAQRKVEMRPGRVFKDCDDCPEMVVIPAGSFEMGSDNGNSDENPVHQVSISLAIAMGKTEVTQRQWRAIMGNNPSDDSNCGEDCPVENVSWNKAREYVRKLSQKTGKTYRLPSEAEWEYACRAGGTQTYCGSNDINSVAWYASNSGRKIHPVAGKQPNAWKIYDMNGNVWEWVEDCWNDSYMGAPSDGTAWGSGKCDQRTMRGGSARIIFSNQIRSAYRYKNKPDSQSPNYGLRVIRVLP